MRLYIFTVVLFIGVESFDLDKFRRDTVASAAAPPRPKEWDNVFRRYHEPLGYPNFLQLCGNGVLNTKADYEAMYEVAKFETGMGFLNVSNRVPGALVRIMVDEVCDDGNRLDGDGCSADCMSADLFQSVCEVASDELIEAMALDSSSGDVYISTSKAVGRVEVGLRGLFTNWNASKSFAVDAMVVSGSNIFMYSASTTTLYRVGKLGIGGVDSVFKFNLVPGERGEFLVDGNDLLLFVKDAHRIYFMDVLNLKMITEFNTTEIIPRPSSIFILGGVLGALCSEKYFSIALDGSRVTFENATAGSGAVQPFWDQFSTLLLRGVSKFEFIKTNATVEFSTEIHPGMFMTFSDPNHFDLGLQLVGALIVNPVVVGAKDSGLRTILVSKPLSISYGSYPDEVYATGCPEIIKSILSNKYDCSSDESCTLDIPLEYDLMKRDTYTSKGRTYYDVLKDILSPSTSPLSTSQEREPLAMQFIKTASDIQRSKIPRTSITIPGTLAMWFLRNGVIYQLNRRGVSIEDSEGRCIPADIMPCPVCQWATSQHMCQPCSVPSPSVAWQVQCKTCGSGSRRLLGIDTVSVTVTIGNSSEAELRRIFSGSVQNSSVVTVESADPAATLRNMSYEISKHPDWKVLSAPQAVYKQTPPAECTPGFRKTPDQRCEPCPANSYCQSGNATRCSQCDQCQIHACNATSDSVCGACPNVVRETLAIANLTLQTCACSSGAITRSLSTLYDTRLLPVSCSSGGSTIVCENFTCPCAAARRMLSVETAQLSFVYQAAQRVVSVETVTQAVQKVVPDAQVQDKITETLQMTELKWSEGMYAGSQNMIIVTVVGVVVFLAVVTLICCCCCKKSKQIDPLKIPVSIEPKPKGS